MNFRYAILLAFMVFLQSCKNSNTSESDGKAILAVSLTPEFYKEINGELRDVLIINGQPIGHVLSAEFIMTPTLSSDKNIKFIVRSIITKETTESYRPIVSWESGEATPNEVKSVTSYGNLIEVEMVYELNKDSFNHRKDVYIKDSKSGKKNVLFSALETSYLSLKFKETIIQNAIFYVPLNL